MRKARFKESLRQRIYDRAVANHEGMMLGKGLHADFYRRGFNGDTRNAPSRVSTGYPYYRAGQYNKERHNGSKNGN